MAPHFVISHLSTQTTSWQQVWPPTLSYHTYPPRLYQLAAGMAPHFVISHLPTMTLPAGGRYAEPLCHITLTHHDSTSWQQVWHTTLSYHTYPPWFYQLVAGMPNHFVISHVPTHSTSSRYAPHFVMSYTLPTQTLPTDSGYGPFWHDNQLVLFGMTVSWSFLVWQYWSLLVWQHWSLLIWQTVGPFW